jgi:sugar/nucleoside kinase (ribokinase family)
MIAASPSYVVFAHLIIDDLRLADGTRADGVLGGAGTYAALGAALVGEEPVGLVSGVGRDLIPEHLEWLASWGIDTSGLARRGERTPRSHVVYRADGSRTETPVFGPEHFASMAPAVADVPAAWGRVRGTYLFAAHDDPQWPGFLRWARQRAVVVMWEISAESCRPDAYPDVLRRLRDVDILSINLAEARSLTGAEDPLACVAQLQRAGGALVTLRMGADGALIADEDRVVAADAVTGVPVVDPTGAGNCYSGAFLAAWGRTGDLERSAALAAAAASRVLGYRGVPPPRDASTSLTSTEHR